MFNHKGGMWDLNPRVPDPQTGVLTKLHQHRHEITVTSVAYFLKNE